MAGWGSRWKPYVPVAERRRKAAQAAAKANKAGTPFSPIVAASGAIATSVWGKAWCDNLERYSDYDTRLPRGRTYVRNGSVVDLAIEPGMVRAQVMGSSLYHVEVRVAAVSEPRWQAIAAECAGSIDSMVELVQGKFSSAVMQRLCRPGDGLFPAPSEITFSCSCPDWASMCKHVAAVLYGVGVRLDQRPELLFALRSVNGNDLLVQARTAPALPRRAPAKAKVLDESALGDVFGIEMAVPASASPATPPAGAESGSSSAASEKGVSPRTTRTKRASPPPADPEASIATPPTAGSTVVTPPAAAPAPSKPPPGKPTPRKPTGAAPATRRRQTTKTGQDLP